MITPAQQLAQGMLSNLLARMPAEVLSDVLRSAIEAGNGDQERARQFLITGIKSCCKGVLANQVIEDHEVIGMIIPLLCLFTLNHSSLQITRRDDHHQPPSTN